MRPVPGKARAVCPGLITTDALERSAPPRYRVIERAYRLRAQLDAAWRTRAELAAALGVTDRTVRRMIDALRAADVAIAQRERAGTRALEYRAF